MKKLTKIILSFFAVSAFVYLTKAFLLTLYQDFNYYYYAAQAVFQGINPYLPGGLYSGYIYPPIDLVFLYPFQLLPLFLASKVWIGLSLVSLLISLVIMFRLCKQTLFSNFSLIVLFLAFIFFPVKFTLGMGQINFFVLLCLVLALYYFAKNKEALSGFFFGLSITIKYFPLFIILYLILRKKWKTLQYLVITVIGLGAVGFLLIDPEINNYFYSTTFISLVNAEGSYYYNQALSGFIGRFMIESSMEFFVKSSISLLILATTFLVIYKNRVVTTSTMLFEMGIIITLNLLLNSFTWQHHFTWLLIPLLFTASIIRKKSEYIILFLIFLLLTFNIKNPGDVSVLWQSHAFYGALLLWGFDLYLLHKVNFKKSQKDNVSKKL